MTVLARYLDRLPAAYVAAAARAQRALLDAVTRGRETPGSVVDEWHEMLAKVRVYGTLTGARHAAGAVDAVGAFRGVTQEGGWFFGQPFAQAVAAFITRYPRVMLDQDDLFELYMDRGFTAAEAAVNEFRGLVERQLVEAVASGEPMRVFRDRMARTYGEAAPYWETVYRTNVSQAYSDGQREQVLPVPGVVGFRRIATRDKSTRPNHAAAHGQVVGKADPDLDWYIGPWGFNCRCTESPLTAGAAERMGLEVVEGSVVTPAWPAAARPDDGFKRGGRG